jgi:hypothetical protein
MGYYRQFPRWHVHAADGGVGDGDDSAARGKQIVTKRGAMIAIKTNGRKRRWLKVPQAE